MLNASNDSDSVATKAGSGVRYVLPQRVHTDANKEVSLFLRVTQPYGKVQFTVKSGDTVLMTAKRLRAAPGEMEKLTLKPEMLADLTEEILVYLEERT